MEKWGRRKVGGGEKWEREGGGRTVGGGELPKMSEKSKFVCCENIFNAVKSQKARNFGGPAEGGLGLGVRGWRSGLNSHANRTAFSLWTTRNS